MLRNNLGKPDWEINGLRVWIHNREFPDSTDYWDSNWLVVTAHCGRGDSNVLVTGSIIHIPELAQLQVDLEKFVDLLQGKVELHTMEPELKVVFEANSQPAKSSNYDIEMKVNITPNQIFENHEFIFEVKKSDLQLCLVQLNDILEKYPVKGTL
jgi:hypothetical protein